MVNQLPTPTRLELEQDMRQHNQSIPVKKNEKEHEGILAILSQTENNLIEAAAGDIHGMPPIITLDDIDIIKRNTITLIQGGFGSHKSRLASTLAALLVSGSGCKTDFLGFEKFPNEEFSVAYIDTERNLKEELPKAVQYIRRLAGYNERENLKELHANSIKQFERKERQLAAKTYIKQICERANNHLIVILDVITDCMSSFNNENGSLELYDFLGNLCEEHDCTVIAVIHENPGSDKARGHAGTEGWNKSSTVFKIGFERDRNGAPTELIKLSFLKLRHAGKPLPLYLIFCPDQNSLVRATPDEIKDYTDTSATDEKRMELESAIAKLFHKKDSYTRTEFISKIEKSVSFKERTIVKYLKLVVNDNSGWISNIHGEACALKKEGGQGKVVTFYLEKLVQNED